MIAAKNSKTGQKKVAKNELQKLYNKDREGLAKIEDNSGYATWTKEEQLLMRFKRVSDMEWYFSILTDYYEFVEAENDKIKQYFFEAYSRIFSDSRFERSVVGLLKFISNWREYRHFFKYVRFEQRIVPTRKIVTGYIESFEAKQPLYKKPKEILQQSQKPTLIERSLFG
jgi:hypothetical protein